jgi:transposase
LQIWRLKTSNFVWEIENLPVADNTADVVKLRAGVVSSSESTPWNDNRDNKVGHAPLSMYLVLESILFVLTEGCSWRAIDRPQARWNSVYQYFRRWCHRGTLEKVLTRFGPELAPGWHFVDSTHVKVHADGSNPAGGQASQAMGRTRGGLNTKIHAVVNARSQAIVIALSSGERSRHFLGRRAHGVPAKRFYRYRRQKAMIAPPSDRQ